MDVYILFIYYTMCGSLIGWCLVCVLCMHSTEQVCVFVYECVCGEINIHSCLSLWTATLLSTAASSSCERVFGVGSLLFLPLPFCCCASVHHLSFGFPCNLLLFCSWMCLIKPTVMNDRASNFTIKDGGKLICGYIHIILQEDVIDHRKLWRLFYVLANVTGPIYWKIEWFSGQKMCLNVDYRLALHSTG